MNLEIWVLVLKLCSLTDPSQCDVMAKIIQGTKQECLEVVKTYDVTQHEVPEGKFLMVGCALSEETQTDE